MTSFKSNDELFAAVRGLIASLRQKGHQKAAGKLQQGFACLNGLTDGWADFLESIEAVQAAHARSFISNDKRTLDRVQEAVRALIDRG